MTKPRTFLYCVRCGREKKAEYSEFLGAWFCVTCGKKLIEVTGPNPNRCPLQ